MLQQLSFILGWLYFAAWSLSFYPQSYLLYKTKTTNGLSIDYVYLNVLGFAILVFTYSFSEVRLNDLAFGWHSLALTIIMLIQTKIYKHSTRLARWTKILISSILTSLFLSFILYTLEFIKFHQILLFLSFYKILLTSIKYTPQLLLNFKKKSTEGWSIANSLLDLAGGVFSILQSGVDAYLMGDEGLIYVMNNPLKLLLGVLSIGYDLMFMYQHYILYSTKNKDVYNDEEEIEDKFVDNACKEEYKKVCSNDNVYAVDNSAKK